MADQKVLALVAGRVEEVIVQQSETTILKVDGGAANTTFPQYLLRLDFGQNGSTINPTGAP